MSASKRRAARRAARRAEKNAARASIRKPPRPADIAQHIAEVRQAFNGDVAYFVAHADCQGTGDYCADVCDCGPCSTDRLLDRVLALMGMFP